MEPYGLGSIPVRLSIVSGNRVGSHLSAKLSSPNKKAVACSKCPSYALDMFRKCSGFFGLKWIGMC